MSAPRPSLFARALRAIGLVGAPTGTRSAVPFTGARMDRLTSDWLGQLLDPNDETKRGAMTLRGRARDLRRNNPLVERYAQLSVENIVGPDGITLQATPGNTRGSVNQALAKQCESVFYGWADRAGLDGRSWDDVCRALVESWRVDAGEALLEIVYDERLPLGIGVQLLDPDLLDQDLNVAAAPGRNEIVQGVERDAFGAPLAFHVFRDHPQSGKRRERRVVPAERLPYLVHRLRADSVRGVTPLAPAMLRLQMLNGTQEALVILHRVAASKMGWFERNPEIDPSDPTNGHPGSSPTMDATPGTIDFAPDGYVFKAWDPGQPTAQYDPFQKSLLREIAAGLGVSYASLTGDLSEASYSSARVGLLAERDRWRVLQRQFAATICQPVYAAVLRAARLRGLLQRPDGIAPETLAAAQWHGRRWDWVDPQKDIAAIGEALGLNLTTLTRELNARGLDVRQVLQERADELRLAKELGVPIGAPAPATPATDGESRPPLKAIA